ncbi:MAG: aminodeoxychorismate/anthranilate synthase component II [Saprospiraceae bacterium]
MRVLLIDNYDSFTYNLVQLIKNCDVTDISVIKNDKLRNVDAYDYDGIIISPGPGLPHESNDLIPFLHKNYKKKPMLGVCLGLQAIVEMFGGRLKRLPDVFHGTQSLLFSMQYKDLLYKSFKKPIKVGRYHSWVASNINFPNDLMITSLDENGEIMSITHKELPIFAVQFHPESILTPKGIIIMRNFIQCCQQWNGQ